MDGLDEQTLIKNPDSTEEIPVLDISAFIAGEPGARERIGRRLREISETVGFFTLIGHGVPREIMDGVFAQSKRFHEQPWEKRQRMPVRDRGGYHPLERKITPEGTAPAAPRSSYFFYKERPPEETSLDWSDPYRLPNDWPQELPGFKEAVTAYGNAVAELGRKMMPLWAEALELPADYFEKFFNDPYYTFSLIQYPVPKPEQAKDFGIRPHADNTIMTLLAQGNVQGLAVRMPSGHWRVADVTPGSFVVNSGNSLQRWTNGRFVSTKHHVINTAGQARYSIPFFFGMDLDATIECVPTCQGPGNPAQYPPITYRDLQNWYFFGDGYIDKSVGPGSKSEGKWSAKPLRYGY